MPLYELGVILDPEMSNEDELAALTRLDEILEAEGGKMVDKATWGRRPLAYPIDKKSHGVYHFWTFDAPGTTIAKLGFEMRTNDAFMRFMALNLDNELKRQRKRVIKDAKKAKKKAEKAKAKVEAEEGAA